MPTLPNPKSGSFTPAPEGNWPAVCYRIVDLGTQMLDFKGQTQIKRQLIINWELFSDERMVDGKNFSIGKKYTWSTHEKATLRKDLELWRGKKFQESDFGEGGFEIRKILGQPCLLQVVHVENNGSVYSNVAGISRLPKQMTVGGPENPIVYLWLSEEEFDQDVFDGLSDKMKEIIGKSPEYQTLKGLKFKQPNVSAGDPNDEIPF